MGAINQCLVSLAIRGPGVLSRFLTLPCSERTLFCLYSPLLLCCAVHDFSLLLGDITGAQMHLAWQSAGYSGDFWETPDKAVTVFSTVSALHVMDQIKSYHREHMHRIRKASLLNLTSSSWACEMSRWPDSSIVSSNVPLLSLDSYTFNEWGEKEKSTLCKKIIYSVNPPLYLAAWVTYKYLKHADFQAITLHAAFYCCVDGCISHLGRLWSLYLQVHQ